MINIIDNLNYVGPQSNFDRDRMDWDKMSTQTLDTLDKGHLVYCTSEEHLGHWEFLGVNEEGNSMWKQVTKADGSVVITINSYSITIDNNETNSIVIPAEDHDCGLFPKVNIYYCGSLVFSDITISETGDVTVSWGNVDLTEDTPLVIKIFG